MDKMKGEGRRIYIFFSHGAKNEALCCVASKIMLAEIGDDFVVSRRT